MVPQRRGVQPGDVEVHLSAGISGEAQPSPGAFDATPVVPAALGPHTLKRFLVSRLYAHQQLDMVAPITPTHWGTSYKHQGHHFTIHLHLVHTAVHTTFSSYPLSGYRTQAHEVSRALSRLLALRSAPRWSPMNWNGDFSI